MLCCCFFHLLVWHLWLFCCSQLKLAFSYWLSCLYYVVVNCPCWEAMSWFCSTSGPVLGDCIVLESMYCHCPVLSGRDDSSLFCIQHQLLYCLDCCSAFSLQAPRGGCFVLKFPSGDESFEICYSILWPISWTQYIRHTIPYKLSLQFSNDSSCLSVSRQFPFHLF